MIHVKLNNQCISVQLLHSDIHITSWTFQFCATTFVETLQTLTSPVAHVPGLAPNTLATTVTVQGTLVASAAGYQYSIVPPISNSEEVQSFDAASCVFDNDGTMGTCVERI
ncbi:hypothetical protein BT96DRAFT_982921 [Gymnopus androsaceus JB14]|uniref:Uncharacterized protein n=1 Tax=Gymnopus androsaceus JB14 TaxID=1447944 RepID=A0A6A4IU72_9AGAR|nr:hypothetical protein BT96DRAFT_982921 [Gymnopus androsaceus JB14]